MERNLIAIRAESQPRSGNSGRAPKIRAHPGADQVQSGRFCGSPPVWALFGLERRDCYPSRVRQLLRALLSLGEQSISDVMGVAVDM